MKKIGSTLIGFFIPFYIFSQTFTEITIYPQGTYYVGGLNNSTDFVVINNELIFFASQGRYSDNSALWRTDGTISGTSPIKSPMFSHYTHIGNGSWEHAQINNTIYFRGFEARNGDVFGAELWKSDGTEAGTVLIKDIQPGTATSRPEHFFSWNDEIYFAADDGIHGSELWKTDGTEAGTMMVRDIFQGTSSSNPDRFIQFGSWLLFRASDSIGGRELWKTDGTSAGTQRVKDINSGTVNSNIFHEMVEFNNKVYFIASNGTHGRELWKTDGTEAGTVMVKDIHPTSNSSPFNLIVYKNKLYFRANHPDYGSELWVTDGTEAGSVLFKDINPGTASSSTGSMFIFNDLLYFSANDGIHGSELWVSDGTPAGTMMAVDIVPGSNSSVPNEYIEYNGKMYFKAVSKDTDYSLYETDGTHGGTHLFAPNDAVGNTHLDDPAFSHPNFISTVFNGALYFWANYYGRGSQLWKYETEPTNTRTISNSTLQLYPNPANNHIRIDLGKIYSYVTIEIHNINGQLIERKRLQSVNQHALNVSQWRKGLYVISVILEEDVVNGKIIKQ